MSGIAASAWLPLLLLCAACSVTTQPDPLAADAATTGTRIRGLLPGAKLDPAKVEAAIESAAAQVRRCYRHPVVPSSVRTISTRLRVRFSPDGSLTDVPMVVSQSGVTPDNQAFAGRMAEAASLAVLRCAPIRLPPELYAGGWNEMDLIFSPSRLL